jgi:hypothetical protein
LEYKPKTDATIIEFHLELCTAYKEARNYFLTPNLQPTCSGSASTPDDLLKALMEATGLLFSPLGGVSPSERREAFVREASLQTSLERKASLQTCFEFQASALQASSPES